MKNTTTLRFRPLLGAVVAILAGAIAITPATAQEITVQNDSLSAGDTVAICVCFVFGEEAAVWLTSPCNGNIVAIQIFWKSQFGGAQPTLEDSILIYEGGTFPVPGRLKKEFIGPQMLDGGLNEYRYQDESQTIPISVPVTAGEVFVVSLAFFNDNNGDMFAPSVVSDTDGVTPGRNAVFTTNLGGWRSNEFLGVSGDWVIRAVIECGADPEGACCLPDGGCDQLTEAECAAASGAWDGAGTDCADTQCAGACFIPSNGNCTQFDKLTCDIVGGEWAGPGTTECVHTCPVDLNHDGFVDSGDIALFVSMFLAADLAADLNHDGFLDSGDINVFVEAFLVGC